MIEPSYRVLLQRPDTFAARLLADLQRDLDRLPTDGEILALHDALDAARGFVAAAAPPAPPASPPAPCATCTNGAPCVLHDALISEGRDG